MIRWMATYSTASTASDLSAVAAILLQIAACNPIDVNFKANPIRLVRIN